MRISGKGVEPVHECVLSNVSMSDLPIAPPKKMIRSVRVTCTAFEPSGIDSTSKPASATRFAGIQGHGLYLYDLPTSKVIGSTQVSSFDISSPIRSRKSVTVPMHLLVHYSRQEDTTPRLLFWIQDCFKPVRMLRCGISLMCM